MDLTWKINALIDDACRNRELYQDDYYDEDYKPLIFRHEGETY